MRPELYFPCYPIFFLGKGGISSKCHERKHEWHGYRSHVSASFFKSAAFYIISAEVEPGLGKQRKCFARYPASALELAA